MVRHTGTHSILCLIGLLGMTWADTFTNNESGDVLKGMLLGKTTKDGVSMLVVKTQDGKQRLLVAEEWKVQKEEKPVKQTEKVPEEVSETPSEKVPEKVLEKAPVTIRDSPSALPGPLGTELTPYVVAMVEAARKEWQDFEKLAGQAPPPGTQAEIMAMANLLIAAKEGVEKHPEVKKWSWSFQYILSVVREPVSAFGRGDYVFPWRGRMNLNKAANPNAVLSAIGQITGQQISKMAQLAENEKGPHGKAQAFAALLSGSAMFVNKADTQAFGAAFENLSKDKVDRVQAFFPQRITACIVLLRAAGRFVAKDGSFDKNGYSSALATVTPERVKAIKELIKLPDESSAVDVILMNASLVAQSE